ncbi:MAG TPA: DoxX family protein [bacterium]|nr:DoxX family protein [bacterium]
MDAAFLVLRVAVGLLVAGHGAQKVFGWFGGHGMAGFRGWLHSIGFRPAVLWSWMGAIVELGGGVLLVLGLLSPLGSIAISSSMLTAIARVHWPKVWATENGFELPLTYLVVALTVAATGPGAYSLDAVLGTALPTAVAVTLGVGALVGWAIGMVISTPRSVQRERSA